MIGLRLQSAGNQSVKKAARVVAPVLLAVALLLLLEFLLAPRVAAVPPAVPVLAPGNPVIHPVRNTHTAPATTAVSITYDEDIDAATVSTRTFAVHAMQTGLLTQTYGVRGGTISLTPTRAFKPGELVQVSATTGTLNLSGQGPVSPTVWQFWAAVGAGGGVFTAGREVNGSDPTYDLALGDLDGDGDVDVFVANCGANEVWLNDGTGVFTDSGQRLGAANSQAVALGDLDGDGDLDGFVGNNGSSDRVWLNDGAGTFAPTPQAIGSGSTAAVALGDLDGDGDLDVFVVRPSGADAEVGFNDGAGYFTVESTEVPSFGAGVGLGDLDGDGDLDAFLATYYDDTDRVLLNDGAGAFTQTAQLPESDSQAAALGDVDGDGDLDAFVAGVGANRVWLNDGAGVFTDSLQTLGTTSSQAVVLGDLDGDGDLDAFVGNADNHPNTIWLNDGTGIFTTAQSLGHSDTQAVALGDVDGDGDLDGLAGNDDQSNEVWLNGPPEVRINQIIPNPSYFGEFVEFNGSGTTVTVTEVLEAYEWTRLGVTETCGAVPDPVVLGRAARLLINSTPVGTHTVCLRARHTNSIWSDYVTATLQVRQDPLAQSDIAVSREGISFWQDITATVPMPNPNVGDTVYVKVEVHNISLHSVTDTVTVSVYDGDVVSGTLVASDTTAPVAAGASESVVVSWTVGSGIDGAPIDGYEDGYKVLTVDIEYTENIPYFAENPWPPWHEPHIESTYENNQATAFIVVGPPITGTYAISVTADVVPIGDEPELYAGYGANLVGGAHYNWGSRIPVMGAETCIEISGPGGYSDTYDVRTAAPFGRYIALIQLPPEPGTYTARIAVFDNNLWGDTAMTFTVEPPPEPLPDLYVERFSVRLSGPGVYERDWHDYTLDRVYHYSRLFGVLNEPVTISARVVNAGDLDAGPFEVSFYDGHPYAGGVRLGKTPVDRLVSGTRTTVSYAWTPAQTGTHVIQLVVDEADVVTESNEINNYDFYYYRYQYYYNRFVHRDIIDVRAGNPDLRATDLAYVEPNDGVTVTMTATVRNIGHRDVGSGVGFTAAVSDGYPGVSNTLGLAQTRIWGPMDQDDGRTIENIVWDTGAAGVDPGPHHICVEVDTGDEIDEELEENNVNCWDCYVFPDEADLYPVGLTFSSDAPLPGTLIAITATIENRGAVTFTGPAVITFYEGAPSGGHVIGAPALEGPIPGRRGAATVSTTYTTPITHGSVYIYAEYVKDEGGYNLGSRTFVRRLTVRPDPPPDLRVRSEDIHVSPRPAVRGDVVSVEVDIANVGVTTATDFVVRFHTDSPSQGLVQLGSSRRVERLAPGMTTTVRANATFVATDPTYAIKVEAMPSVRQGDHKLGDNEATTSVEVVPPPDLTISKDILSNRLNASYPSLEYMLTITNAGGVNATAPFTVTDVMPSGLGFEGGTVEAWGPDRRWDCVAQNLNVTCTYPGPLGPGAGTQVHVRGSSSGRIAPPDTITNCATVRTAGADDPDPANNTACYVLELGGIAGRVSDADGLGLEDIAVFAYRDRDRRDVAGWARTDATGHYTVACLEAGAYKVWFRDWSYPCRYDDEYYDDASDFDDADLVTVTKGTVNVIDAVLEEIPAGTLAGIVTDAGGRPLAGVYVAAYRDGGPWGYAGGTRTDVTGRYTLAHLGAGTYTVRFEDRSWPPRYHDHEEAVNITADTTTTINAVLDGIARGTLAGTVTGPHGPLENISVIARRSDGDRRAEYWASPDATGQYTFTDLQVGTYTVWFRDWSGNCRNEYYDDVDDFDEASPVSVISGTKTVVDASLDALTEGTITGTVCISGGTGVEGVDVVAYPLYVDQDSYARSNWRGGSSGAGWGWSRNWLDWAIHHPEVGITATDATGAFTLTLPTGPYRLYFRDRSGDFEPQYYDGVDRLGEASVITVTEDMRAAGFTGDRQALAGGGIQVRLDPLVPPNARVDAAPHSSAAVGNGVRGVAMPWSDQADVTLRVTAHLSPCASGSLTAELLIRALTGTEVLAGPYAMESTGGADEYAGSIPGLDLVDGDVIVRRYCNGQPAGDTSVAVIELHDPSGRITDKGTGNPIPGATVTLYKVPGWQPKATPFDDAPNTCPSYNSKMPGEPWSQPAPVELGETAHPAWGEFDPRANPQTTDESGCYTWDLAEGCWYVVAEAEGYASETSPVAGAPPQVTDLDLALEYRIYLPLILKGGHG